MESPGDGKSKRDSKIRDASEAEDHGSTCSILSCLPCFKSYRGDMGPTRTVISNAPFSTDQELLYNHSFISNYVRTTRYTWWNFLPKNLWEQFQRAANVYFLIMAIITGIPGVSTIPVYSTVTPLIFVLGVTAIKDAIDDYKRYTNDKILNQSRIEVLKPGGETEPTRWDELQVGHIVKVKQNGFFPADLVVLRSSESNGECGIQTATLDGETSLKIRQAVKETSQIEPVELAKEGLITVKCERPHTTLYRFEGQLFYNKQTFALNQTHLLPRGAALRETKYIYGLVVYTGDQTKIMLNNDPPRFKRSHMDSVMNKQMYLIFILQFCIVFTATVLSGWFYVNRGPDHWYLRITDDSEDAGAALGLRNFFAFYVLLSVMVPISLYVSMELVRLGQALLINVDNRMWDPEDNKLGSAKNTTLSEELGQIEYIFSDKTGTLTSNQMAFQKCSILGKLYGDNPEESDEKERTPGDTKKVEDSHDPNSSLLKSDGRRGGDYTKVSPEAIADLATGVEIDGDPKFCNMRDPTLLSALLNGDKAARDYVLALALCHTCNASADPRRPGKVIYQGESTDEIALVTMASFHGVRFVARKRDEVTLVLPWKTDYPSTDAKSNRSSQDKPTGTYVTFKILHIIAFSSDRKRMSVIVRFPDGSIRVITKGADNVIKELSNKDPAVNSKDMWQQTDGQLHHFSREGLRVMLVGQLNLSDKEYKSWSTRYQQASESFADATGNRSQKMAKIAAEVEKDLKVLGVTAIEDKLQDGVPLTLKLLKKAGIKIWVLTGDKQNTAVNIGKSCGLIGWSYKLCYIRETEKSACLEQMSALLDNLENSGDDSSAALMVSGESLKAALCDDQNRDRLFEVMNHPRIRVVVASRMSPRQKAEIVGLVKEKLGVVTLAIGDGANDVSMIRAAHVGVGLRGKEGMQAANASDYAISKFRFLTQLLLVHGTLSYYRNSILILYFFYKNIMIAVQQVYFLFFAGYSSEEVFDGYMLNTFNLMWTALPILLFSVFDRPANVDELLEFPQLYLTGLRGELFNFTTFWLAFGEAVVHGSILFLTVWHTLHDIFDSYWVCSVATYSAVVLVANTKMAMITTTWFWFNVLIIFLTVIVYFGFIYLYSGDIGFEFSPWIFGIFEQMMREPMFYLVALWLCLAVFLQDLFLAYLSRLLRPSLLQLVQECRGENHKKEALLVALNDETVQKDSEWQNKEMDIIQMKKQESEGEIAPTKEEKGRALQLSSVANSRST
uniref:Phospholipid-transporting ATPase n=1 Tax=Norrisiella sphaerica TaxID=552664 RepID=A0A7S2QSA1_9EUKA|mmetsp:Transcript_1885/g.2672  ORF Transcript_1885/g.2672 Transcript_1885/m.2672 type:complete len:1241 (+) Transcript_1885:152-3874(+)